MFRTAALVLALAAGWLKPGLVLEGDPPPGLVSFLFFLFGISDIKYSLDPKDNLLYPFATLNVRYRTVLFC